MENIASKRGLHQVYCLKTGKTTEMFLFYEHKSIFSISYWLDSWSKYIDMKVIDMECFHITLRNKISGIWILLKL